MKKSLITIGSGALLSFLSFVFAAVNMGIGALNVANGDINSFFVMFAGHIGAMIGLALGGLVTTIGTLMLLWSLYQAYLASRQ